ncbi:MULTISPECIES: hypothetical protein [Burkholderia]|uniref:hypothetical protein n=1 Tax=Burkholderia TaxID=32008 RepID=UPI0015836946|nr:MULTISPECIES: hypothetical protein [Burkholderia]MDN7488413.1 hypothetical protein [Burkholderia sp. AU45274]
MTHHLRTHPSMHVSPGMRRGTLVIHAGRLSHFFRRGNDDARMSRASFVTKWG